MTCDLGKPVGCCTGTFSGKSRSMSNVNCFCQNWVFIKLLLFNIFSIISGNNLVKLACIVQKNSDL